MKRLLSVFFALLYISTASGVTVTAHYCGKSVSSLSFYADASSCSCPAKMKKKGCCSKNSRFIKLKESHKASSFQYIQPDFTLLSRSSFVYYIETSTSQDFSFRHSKAPPDAIYLRNAVLRT